MDAYCHPFDFEPSKRWYHTFPGTACRTRPFHTVEFYQTLNELLKQQDIKAVAYRGACDYETIAALCRAQLARTDEKMPSMLAMEIFVLTDSSTTFDVAGWGCSVRYSLEGLPEGDLYIDHGCFSGASLKKLVEEYGPTRARWMLSAHDQGQISGYDCESGNGWWTYRKNHNNPQKKP